MPSLPPAQQAASSASLPSHSPSQLPVASYEPVVVVQSRAEKASQDSSGGRDNEASSMLISLASNLMIACTKHSSFFVLKLEYRLSRMDAEAFRHTNFDACSGNGMLVAMKPPPAGKHAHVPRTQQMASVQPSSPLQRTSVAAGPFPSAQGLASYS